MDPLVEATPLDRSDVIIRVTMQVEIPQAQLDEIYDWIHEIPLTRSKKNLTRDFSDAEIVQHYFPKLVEMHNYPKATGASQKLYNWKTLRQKVFKKLKYTPSDEVLAAIANAKPGYVELLLIDAKIQAASYHSLPMGISFGDMSGNPGNLSLPPLPIHPAQMMMYNQGHGLSHTQTHVLSHTPSQRHSIGQPQMYTQSRVLHPHPQQTPMIHESSHPMGHHFPGYGHHPYHSVKVADQQQQQMAMNSLQLTMQQQQQQQQTQKNTRKPPLSAPKRPVYKDNDTDMANKKLVADLRETIRLLTEKVEKLEGLVSIKDKKIAELSRLQKRRSTIGN